MLEWDRELVVEHVKENVGGFLVCGSDSKVVDLALEYEPFACNRPGV